MNRQNIKPNVIGPIFQGISALLAQEGINSKKFYQQFSLQPEIEHDIQQLIEFEVFIKVLDEIKTLTTIKHPSLYLANYQTEQKTTPYFELILSAPTIEIAFQLARRFRYVYSEVTYWDWSVDNNFVVIKRCSFVPLKANDREHCLYTIATVFLILRSLLNTHSLIDRVSLVQPENKYKHELEKFFNCSISFSQDFDGFILSEKSFYKPNDNFDAKKYHDLLAKMAHHKVIFPQNQTFSTSVKILIIQMLSTGHCSLNSVAKQLEMHPRAVQKKLFEEQLTFKNLVNNVRMNTAKRLLRQADVSLLKISAILGYSETSAFSRAFHAENQCSPRYWRKVHLQTNL